MNEKIKAVVDTSVFIAALKSSNVESAPVKVLRGWYEGNFILILSPQILEEIVRKLLEYDFEEELITDLLSDIKVYALMIPGDYSTDYLDQVDPKDNMLLAAAFEAKANYLVTLDKKHLLPLKHFKGTSIVAPFQFNKEIESYKQGENSP